MVTLQRQMYRSLTLFFILFYLIHLYSVKAWPYVGRLLLVYLVLLCRARVPLSL